MNDHGAFRAETPAQRPADHHSVGDDVGFDACGFGEDEAVAADVDAADDLTRDGERLLGGDVSFDTNRRSDLRGRFH